MEQDLTKTAGSGTWLIQRMLEGVEYAGTGTKQELVELEKNLRQLLQLRMYPFSYIEKYLMSQGYLQHDIRKIFFELTGISPEEFLEENYNIMTVPGCIPQVNLGWGECKGKDHDFMFIMPWQVGYAVFGQKGDLERTEIERFDILEDAREFVKKKVKEYRQFDKVPELKTQDPKGPWFSSFSEPKFSSLTDQGRAVLDYVKYVGGNKPSPRNAQYIKDAYFNGLITKGDFTVLASTFISASDDVTDAEKRDLSKQLETLEDQEMVRPLEEELSENSPQDFMDNQAQEDVAGKISDMTVSIEKYLDKKSSELKPEYSILLRSLKFLSTPRVMPVEQNVSTSNSKPDEVLQSTGVMAVVLDMSSLRLGAGSSKMGMMVFSMRDGELRTQGVFKGSDGKIYAMSKEGLEKYFSDLETGNKLDIMKNLF